jgi:hypothetical protein
MKYLALVLVGFFAFSAHSESPSFETSELFMQGTSHFDSLVSFYNQGQKPAESDLLGVRAGREYLKESPNKATGAFLICENHDPLETDGPLFPELGMGCGNGAFEKYHVTDIDKGLPKTEYSKWKPYIGKVSIDIHGNETCYSNVEQFPFQEKWQGMECYRKYGSYLIYVVTSLKAGPNFGEVTRAGYFFKKVPVLDQ